MLSSATSRQRASTASSGARLFYIGCSGWQYRHWKPDFYPSDVPQRRWLEFYASRFQTVEINNSFYCLPDAAVVRDWRDRTPSDFVFAWKASRYLTHLRKLQHPGDPLARLFERARGLGSKLEVVLYQLPPRWRRDVARLEAFLAVLPRDVRHAIEFRDPSWYDDDVLGALDRAGVALCLHDMPGSATPRESVGGFAYVRFHGADPRYAAGYSRAVLRGWATWLRGEVRAGRPVFAYFNNDVHGHAHLNAATLRRLVG